MSDFATLWTAPYWATRYWALDENTADEDTPAIVVVNRGFERAHATVTWLLQNGSVVQADKFEVDPNHQNGSSLLYNNAPNEVGWARITSDQPVAPSGYTPHDAYERAWVNIQFYRENVVQVENLAANVADLLG
jgi:hypothetical protein